MELSERITRIIGPYFTQFFLFIDEQAVKFMNWLLERTVSERYEIGLSVCAAIWIIHAVISKAKKRKPIKSKKRLKIPPAKFTSDGYYWDEKKGKWIEPDFKKIPDDYYWDEIDGRWLPPNHPNHPRFHMNDRDLTRDDEE